MKTFERATSIIVLSLFVFALLVPLTTTFAATEIIVGEGDSGYSEKGKWSASSVKGYNDKASKFSTEDGASATYIPSLKEAGNYNVYAFKVFNSNSTKEQPYTISHNGKTDKAKMDLTTGQSEWTLLGVYDFAGNNDESVVLNVVGGKGAFRVSAIKFEKTSAETSNIEEKPTPSKEIPSTTDKTKDESPYYVEAVSLVTELGIMSGSPSNFGKDSLVTRGDFVKSLMLLCNAPPSKASIVFKDVPQSHSAAAYINTAYELGYINGYDDKTFKPNEKITLIQAIKLVISALHYDYLTEGFGGYPFGYLTVANQNNLLKGISSDMDKELSKRNVALLFYNALSIDMASATNFGRTINYEIQKGKNLLSEAFMVAKGEGIVTGDYLIQLGSTNDILENEVEIDKVKFEVGKLNPVDLVGCRVVYYYKYNEDTEKKTLIYIAPSNKNQTLEIYSGDVSKYGANEIEYDDKTDKSKKIQLSTSLKLFKNNELITSVTEANILPNDGYIKFIDNDNDDIFDVAVVRVYTNYFIDSVSTTNKKAYDKFDKPSIIFDSNDIKYIILKDGNKIKYEDLSENDVLSVVMNTSKTVIFAELSKNTVNGEINEISTTNKTYNIDGNTYNINGYTVDNKVYEVATNYIVGKNAHNGNASELTTGMSGTLFLDVNGKIAAFKEEIKPDEKHAYVINCVISDNLEKMFQLKLLDADGKIKFLKTSKKVRVNDQKSLTAEEAYNMATSNGTVKRQLIKYELDKDNNISKIYTAINKTTEPNYVPSAGEFIKSATSENFIYTSGSLNQKVWLNKNASIFYIPLQEKDEYYRLTGVSELFVGGKYKMDIFDVTENRTSSIAVLYETLGNNDLSSTLTWDSMAISKISQGIKESDSSLIWAFTGYVKGVEKVLYYNPDLPPNVDTQAAEYKDTTSLLNLKPGSVIQFFADSRNEIRRYRVLLKIETALAKNSIWLYSSAPSLNSDSSYGGDFYFRSSLSATYGKVVKISNGMVTLDAEHRSFGNVLVPGYTYHDLKVSTRAKYLKCTNNKFEPATINDVTRDSYLFIRYSNSSAQDVIIYDVE